MTRSVLVGLAVVAFALPLRAASPALVPDAAVLKAEAERVAVIAKASASTVAVFESSGEGGGSGVLISADGFALTNFHVSSATGDALKCGLNNGEMYDAVIVGVDPVGDVALIKLLGRADFPAAPLGNSDVTEPGDWVFAAGNPFLLATDFQPTITYGIVSGTHRYQYPSGTLLEYTDCLQIDASINPGNSGGPLFNARGELIGINGRGSFEKRGRVNVGVAYAISINQIKNFLGYLHSGRIVDHATLGARVSSEGEGRVQVSDILENSDAYRRGLRYGDEVLSFAGRPVRSANALKNVLGIFPRDFRVPLTYRREGKTYDVMVRLAGVHDPAELAEKASGHPKPEGDNPRPRPGTPPMPKPGGKPGDKPNDQQPDGQPPKPDGPEPKPVEPTGKSKDEAKIPAAVRDVLVKRPGYANYYFNQQEQQRVRNAVLARGALPAGKTWTIKGELAQGGDAEFTLSETVARCRLPGGELNLNLDEDLRAADLPSGTGGLLPALGFWRAMVLAGPEHFNEAYYVGTAPLAGHDGLVDVMAVTHRGANARFYFDAARSELLCVEVYLGDDVDPCELYLSDYQESGGAWLPRRIEVRHSDQTYLLARVTSFETGGQTEAKQP